MRVTPFRRLRGQLLRCYDCGLLSPAFGSDAGIPILSPVCGARTRDRQYGHRLLAEHSWLMTGVLVRWRP